MSKHDKAKIAKRLRNEEYAKKFRKKKSAQRVKGVGANWCRTLGHPQSCSCIYESAVTLA